MKIIYRILLVLHIFVGIGAMAGGSIAIFNPYNPLGIPVETLSNSPFTNFFIPGIILFTVIGLGNILSGILINKGWKYREYISVIASGALSIWIVVQCIMLNDIVFLHVLYFVIGAVGVILAAIAVLKQGLFPADIVVKLFNKIKRPDI